MKKKRKKKKSAWTNKKPSAEMMAEQTRATLKDVELLSDNEIFGKGA